MKGSFLCLRWQHTLMDNHAKHTHVLVSFACGSNAAGDSFHPGYLTGTCGRDEDQLSNLSSGNHRWGSFFLTLTPIWANAKSCRPWRRSRSPSARAPSAGHTRWPGPAPASTEAAWADFETLHQKNNHKRKFIHHLSDLNVSNHQIPNIFNVYSAFLLKMQLVFKWF